MPSEHSISRLQQVELILTGKLDPDTLSRDEIQTLVKELQLAHQVELDAQNHQLQETQVALEASRDNYAGLYDFAPVALFTLNTAGVIQEVNRTGARLLGRDRQQLLKQRVEQVVLWEDRDALYLHLRQLLETGLTPSLQIQVARADGTACYVQVESSLIGNNTDQACQVRLAMSDITTLKQTQQELEARLKEKDVLLKEIHHRVKNSLQAASNLIYLQSTHIADESVREIFRETQHRIKSIALIHEKLDQPANLAEIDFVDYTRTLIADLLNSYKADPESVQVSVESDQTVLALDVATPLGIIINELVSNALKYAFPPQRSQPAGQADTITIRLRSADPSRLILVVADNGIGLPPELDISTTPTLGLQMVSLLVSNLNGTLDIDRNNGAIFTMVFNTSRV